MSFPRYDSYKDSGVEWLDEVPEHWFISSFKHVADYINGYPFKPEEWSENGLPIIRIAQLTSNVDPNYFGGNINNRHLVQDGNLLFSWSATIDAFIWSKGDAWLNQHIFKVKPFPNIHQLYLYHLIRFFAPKLAEIDAHGSTMKHIKKESLAQHIPLPPKEEQKNIAHFLDQETAKIDNLITEQERLIALLKEKRQAVISHAVTKGLNPDVPMKDSGVEWLGEVPEHWRVSRLKTVLSEPLMYGANEAAEQDNPENPRFVRITDITANGSLREDTFRSLPNEIACNYLLNSGDVLLARSGATVGKSFIYRQDWGACCFAGYLIRARLNIKKMLASFLFLFCQTNFYWQFISSNQVQATIQNVSAEKYSNLLIPTPRLEEQYAIIVFLDQETAKIDNLITESTNVISLLKERRSALISSAVTGKIDVRSFVPSQPNVEAMA